jgi:predicted ATPase
MELDDGELELVAKSLGITVDSLARKVQRLPTSMQQQAASELDRSDALLRRVRDEQRARRKASA